MWTNLQSQRFLAAVHLAIEDRLHELLAEAGGAFDEVAPNPKVLKFFAAAAAVCLVVLWESKEDGLATRLDSLLDRTDPELRLALKHFATYYKEMRGGLAAPTRDDVDIAVGLWVLRNAAETALDEDHHRLAPEIGVLCRDVAKTWGETGASDEELDSAWRHRLVRPGVPAS